MKVKLEVEIKLEPPVPPADAMAKLRLWLERIAVDGWMPELGAILLKMLDAGKLRYIRRRAGEAEVSGYVAVGAEAMVQELLRDVDSVEAVVLASMFAEGEMLMQLGTSGGRPDLYWADAKRVKEGV